MKKGFTLAEIMIVLSVIAILTAILLPSARNAMPNENVIKFKKGHETFYRAINELTTSDKYYLDGDLGTKIDGTRLSSWAAKPEQRKYFCETFADVLSAKHVECSEANGAGYIFLTKLNFSSYMEIYNSRINQVTQENLAQAKEKIDFACKKVPIATSVPTKQFITPNGIWYYDLSPMTLFGVIVYSEALGLEAGKELRIFSPPNQQVPTFHDANGMDVAYKIFCMDVDGVPDNATEDDCINECPFGYGVRADGKILNGTRADEWLSKSIQEK